MKNHRNSRNNNRIVFKKRFHPSRYKKKAELKDRRRRGQVARSVSKSSDGNNDTNATLLNGSRIINLEKLKEYISALTVHAAQCRSEIVLIGEKKAGLASVLSSKCAKCHFSILRPK